MNFQESQLKYVEKAISLGIQEYEGLFKIEIVSPFDNEKKLSAYLAVEETDERIGTTINDIMVAKSGENLQKILFYTYNMIDKYPYYWKKEGQSVNKFGYDFVINYNDYESLTFDYIDMTSLSFEILDKELSVSEEIKENYGEITTDYENYIDEGGAMVRIVITLNKPKLISSFSLSTLSKFPLKLASLVYEEDTEVLRIPKSINIANLESTNKKLIENKESILFQFPAVIAKRLTFVLKQENYVKDIFYMNETDLQNKALWNKISEKEALISLKNEKKNDSIVNSLKDYATLTNLKEYEAAEAKYQKELAVYKKELKKYNDSVKANKEAIATNNANAKKYQSELDSYNEKLKKEKAAYADKVKAYTIKKKDYDKKVNAYKEKMNSYEKAIAKIKSKYSK